MDETESDVHVFCDLKDLDIVVDIKNVCWVYVLCPGDGDGRGDPH